VLLIVVLYRFIAASTSKKKNPAPLIGTVLATLGGGLGLLLWGQKSGATRPNLSFRKFSCLVFLGCPIWHYRVLLSWWVSLTL